MKFDTFFIYRYSETSVMHVLLNLLTIKCLYMFRALMGHPQEVLHIRHLVYCVSVCQLAARTQYTKCRWCSAFLG
jgi:hypothetical protein